MKWINVRIVGRLFVGGVGVSVVVNFVGVGCVKIVLLLVDGKCIMCYDYGCGDVCVCVYVCVYDVLYSNEHIMWISIALELLISTCTCMYQ